MIAHFVATPVFTPCAWVGGCLLLTAPPCPQLVVHVGVSGMATTVTLEKCGHNKGYKGLDNCRFCPGSQCCVEDGPESIDSIIDMDAVCKRVTTLGLDVSVTISQDAGRWAVSSREAGDAALNFLSQSPP